MRYTVVRSNFHFYAINDSTILVSGDGFSVGRRLRRPTRGGRAEAYVLSEVPCYLVGLTKDQSAIKGNALAISV